MQNRLSGSTSPYLLQHAHNPVDWFPWGPEALEKAKSENKLILLSVGYSACHWCHVMEKNCFEDEEIAAVMNAHFVNIKVDREERPDVDNLYMDALHLMGIQGGWPMNVFLTPDQLPFYGGTYFPPAQWLHILQQIADAHKDKPQELQEIGERNRTGLTVSENQRVYQSSTLPEFEIVLQSGLQEMKSAFDSSWGGFGREPKFPMPCIYRFLLHHHAVSGDKNSLKMAVFSLEKIALGGIHDVLAGGFARYSVDKEWRVPHFEKMLYDNAQLCSLFSIAFRESGMEIFQTAAEGIINFVNVELSHPSGAFFSALDADTEGEEGLFYVWKQDEVKQILGEDFETFSEFYPISESGNFEHGFSVLCSPVSEAEFLSNKNPDEAQKIRELLSNCRQKLLGIRNKRTRPGLDDKVICSWNGLMISGLCDAYRVFEKAEYLQRAMDCAKFIQKEMMDEKSGLFRIWKNGQMHTPAFLEDHAILIQAFIDLYECSFEEEWLQLAEELARHTIAHFQDPEDGLFFFNSDLGEKLTVRKKEISDNVIPSSNSMIALALNRLGRLLYDDLFIEIPERMLESVRPMLKGDIRYMSQWMQLLLNKLFPAPDLVVYGADSQEFRKKIEKYGIPGMTIAGSAIASAMPAFQHKSIQNHQTMVYVCQHQNCLQPSSSLEDINEILKKFRKD